MDVLRAYILLLHAKTARDGFPVRHAIGEKEMTPQFAGIGTALQKLKFNFNQDATKLTNRIANVDQRRSVAFEKANTSLDSAEAQVNEVESFVADLEGSNGAPTSTPTVAS
jgi:hypothetical protein